MHLGHFVVMQESIAYSAEFYVDLVLNLNFGMLHTQSQLHRVVTTMAGVVTLPAANIEGLLDSEPGVFSYNVLLLRDLLLEALQQLENRAAQNTIKEQVGAAVVVGVGWWGWGFDGGGVVGVGGVGG